MIIYIIYTPRKRKKHKFIRIYICINVYLCWIAVQFHIEWKWNNNKWSAWKINIQHLLHHICNSRFVCVCVLNYYYFFLWCYTKERKWLTQGFNNTPGIGQIIIITTNKRPFHALNIATQCNCSHLCRAIKRKCKRIDW